MKAVRWLREAAGLGLPNFPLFSTDPHLQGLRGEPEFNELMADLEQQWRGFAATFGPPAGSP